MSGWEWMDYALAAAGMLAVAGAAVLLARSRPEPQVMDDFLSRWADAQHRPGLTAAQKLQACRELYRRYDGRPVEMHGMVSEVFPNGTVVMATSSRHLPYLGFEIVGAPVARLQRIMKGDPVVFRGSMASWDRFRASLDVLGALRRTGARCGGQWYRVRDPYRARFGGEAAPGARMFETLSKVKDESTGQRQTRH